jgi:hypothetical protein
MIHFGPDIEEILRRLNAAGYLFPYLRSVRSGDRATEFKQRCEGLGIKGVTLHSYRYAWAERAKTCGYLVVEFEMRDDVSPVPPGEARSEMLESAVKRGLRARLKSQGVTGTSFLSLEYLNSDENPPAQVPGTPKHTCHMGFDRAFP